MSAERKRAERQRRKDEGQVEAALWLSKEDHASLTQMAREAGMTQGQVVSRLIGMRAAVLGLERVDVHLSDEGNVSVWPIRDGRLVVHSDLTAAVGL